MPFAADAEPLIYPTADAARPRAIMKWLIALAILAFAIRVGAFVEMRRWRQPNDIEHRQLAANLLLNGTFAFRDFEYFGPSSVQSPTYPAIVAASFAVFGFAGNAGTPAAYNALFTLNALAGAITVVFVGLLVLELGRFRLATADYRTADGGFTTTYSSQSTIALLAAALVAFWPSQIYAAGFAQAISLITLAVSAMCYFYLKAMRTGNAGAWIAYSAIGCLAALTEPVLLPVTAFSGLLVLFWRGVPKEIRFRNALILFAAAAIIIGPWTLRNRMVHGKFVPIKATFWVNIWKSANPYATGTDRPALTHEQFDQLKASAFSFDDSMRTNPDFDRLRQYDMIPAEQYARLRGQPEAVREELFKEFATTWIKANPGKWIELCFVRLWKTLWIDLDNPKAVNWIYIGTRTLILPLTFAGLAVAVWRKWRVGFPVLLVASCWLTYTFTITANRFGIPLEPLQLIMVALLGVVAYERLRSRSTPAIA